MAGSKYCLNISETNEMLAFCSFPQFAANDQIYYKNKGGILMVNEAIKKLVCYGLEHGLITEDDVTFTTNQLLETLQMDEYEEPDRKSVV